MSNSINRIREEPANIHHSDNEKTSLLPRHRNFISLRLELFGLQLRSYQRGIPCCCFPRRYSRTTPLHLAIKENKQDMITYLITNNLHLNDEVTGLNPICLAASLGKLDIVIALMQQGVFVDSPSENKTPLEFAFTNKHLQVTNYLMLHGANFNVISATALFNLLTDYPVNQLIEWHVIQNQQELEAKRREYMLKAVNEIEDLSDLVLEPLPTITIRFKKK